MVSLALDPPPSRGGRNPQGTRLRSVALYLALGGAAAAGFVLGRWTAPGGRFAVTLASGSGPGGGGPEPGRPSDRAPAPSSASAAPVAATPGQPPSVAQAAAGVAPVPAPAAAPSPAGTHRVSVTLSGALEESISRALPPEDRPLAEELTQVVNRLLVWDMQVARDGRKGDRLEVVYAPPESPAPGVPASGEPVVHGVRFASQKLMRTIAAYRFKAAGAKWARFFRPDGTELEERLVDSPVSEYDQITSLLRDGRRHKGVDFRTPVGTPVLATFEGVIERRNWNFASNGNCLDLRDLGTGRHAIFLHLEVLPHDMVPGRRVKKGEQIASSGNSGRSFAPHVHYQLESADGRVLDPFEIQPLRRVAVDAAVRPAFEAERARLDALLAGAALAQAAPAPPAAPAAPAPGTSAPR
jgi:murein DD-endopeptidase MepM/ murein hydrolase activator NlpD